MAEEPHISYGKSNITLKELPKTGENLNVYLRPGDELHSILDLSKAQYQMVQMLWQLCQMVERSHLSRLE